MRPLKWILLVALVSLAQPALARTLRVLSYNIHHSEGRDGVFDLDRIANVIRAATPDVVALQELDQGNGRSGFDVLQLNQLAELTGMEGYFGKTINYSGGEYGNGVLVSPSVRITRAVNHPLPNLAGGEARAVIEVGLSLGAVEAPISFTFFATHFDASGDDANRFAQAGFVNNLVASSTTPSLLAGDLNARPASRVFQRILEEWTDATNVSSPGLSRASQIDYVLYRLSEQWRVVDKGRFIVNATTQVASDHYPILTVVELLHASADFDGDNDVDGADFLQWQRGVGGELDATHLGQWKASFGPGPQGIGATVGAVIPEPTSLGLLGLFVPAISLIRRRRR